MAETKLFLIGIATYGAGLVLVFASNQHRWGVFLSVAGLLLLGIDSRDAISGVLVSRTGGSLRALASTGLLFGLLIAMGREYLRDRDLRARLLALRSSFTDFVREIVERAAEFDAWKGSETKISEYDRWIHAAFTNRHEKHVTEIFREAIEVGWFDGKTATKLLQMPFRGEGRLYSLFDTKIGVIAGFLNGIWEAGTWNGPLRPEEWLRRLRFWRTLIVCLIAAVATWFALGIQSRHWPIWR
jgi:hypothetical protein